MEPYALNLLSNVLQSCGFEIKRLPNASRVRSAPRRPTSGLILEFIGAKGVGKSTLFNATLSKCGNRWFCRHHLDGIYVNAIESKSVVDVHRRLLLSRLEAIRNTPLDAWQVATAMRAHAQVILESLRLSLETFPRGFALDEGLFKNFTREVLELEGDDSDSLWNRRAFVYVRAGDPAIVIGRYLRRIAERAAVSMQHVETVEEIDLKIRTNTELCDRMIAKAKDLGRPFLIVNAEDPFDVNIQRVLEFEESFR